jgi:hypothetical protein
MFWVARASSSPAVPGSAEADPAVKAVAQTTPNASTSFLMDIPSSCDVAQNRPAAKWIMRRRYQSGNILALNLARFRIGPAAMHPTHALAAFC